MKKLLTLILATVLLLCNDACRKSDESSAPDLKTLEANALSNFVDGVARPQYNDLAQKSDSLYNSIIVLQSSATESDLEHARTAWKDMRAVWERCEGFLFGPVEDEYYDPYMDTWPTDYVQMDSLLASSNALTVADIEGITLSLRGFHPIEYILFGRNGSQTAGAITGRQKQYILSLSADVRNNCHKLANAWSPGAGNYGSQIINAGGSGSKYGSRREVFFAMVDGLIEICEEVGEGKMEEPYARQDAQKVESPFSGNSVTDFRNNIAGLQNVYFGRYAGDGTGLAEIVALGNASLDNRLQSRIVAALLSFDNITHPYGQAIFDQQQQILQTQAALGTLKQILEQELRPYINTIIKD